MRADTPTARERLDGTVHVLWTSGWDSTFRVAQLLETPGDRVQPWYVRDPERGSTRTELRRLGMLRRALTAHERFDTDRLAPVRVVTKSEIAPDEEISSQFARLLADRYWGSQYEWLARLAKMADVRLEIGLKADDEPIRRLGAFVVPVADAGGFRIDPEAPAEDLGDLSLFRWFSFPLADVTKLEMKGYAERNGFADIMELTWFCHNPLLAGRACGYCPPCEHARAEGFGWRVPDPGPLRRAEARLTRRVRRALARVRPA